MAKYKQDDIVKVKIASFGMDGEGVAREDEFVFFVPFALPGEEVSCKVTYVKKNLVFAELKEVLTPSASRVKPPCNRFVRCGGCDLMHLKYSDQLELKRANVANLFRKNAGLDVFVAPTVPCSTPQGYRNKIQLPFGTVNGKVAMGFYRENSHKIVSITKCFLHGEWVEKLIKVFVEYAQKYGVSAYDDLTKKGVLRHLVARNIDDKYCIVVVTNNSDLPKKKELIDMLRNAIGDDFSLFLSKKTDYTNVILGKEMIELKHFDFIIDVLGVKLPLNPYSFLQLNNEIRDKIYNDVIERILKNSEGKKLRVFDAYAGVGVLGAVLAKRGINVTNIEIVKEATEDGISLAKLNGIEDKVTVINGDAAVKLPEAVASLEADEEAAVILDPPRKGCDERVLKAISSLNVSHTIYYISCNPATLTRDVKILLSSGDYALSTPVPYDMFPQTKHVETLVVLSRKTPNDNV